MVSFSGRGWGCAVVLAAWAATAGCARAQGDTNSIPDPTALETPGAAAHPYPVAQPVFPATNDQTAPAMPEATPVPSPMAATPVPAPKLSAESSSGGKFDYSEVMVTAGDDEQTLLEALVTLAGLGGFLLYQCGMTRAKNCAHTAMMLLLGVTFGLLGYWMGGFAVQTGGVDDVHAALPRQIWVGEPGALDHELRLAVGGHHWGLMGNTGFFLASDNATRDGMAGLFFVQATLLAVAIAAALGAALERARLLAMAVTAFLSGAVIYPLVANWIWGGGWLAELGREFSLGHGAVDLGGAGVVHETAGVLALAIALAVGPRMGRFKRYKTSGIPGHNVPFTILGAMAIVIGLAASNLLVNGTITGRAGSGPAITNVLLGALAGLVAALVFGTLRKKKATPARLSRGLLGGGVAICGGSTLYEPWAAFVVGACAGLIVEGVTALLERQGVDDPVNATAIHGAGGAWGLAAVGFFANGSDGHGMNGVDGAARGLFYGGGLHQLAAQVIAVAADFAVVFVLGYLALLAVKKTVGLRVKASDEVQGLDWAQVGALGYQPDVETFHDEPHP